MPASRWARTPPGTGRSTWSPAPTWRRSGKIGATADPRRYTIHSDLVTDAALARLARAGLSTNMNPSIKAAIADAGIGVLGPQSVARQRPMRSALDAGVTLKGALCAATPIAG